MFGINIGPIINVVSAALQVIGPAIDTFREKVLPRLVPAIQAAGEVIDAVKKLGTEVLRIFGLVREDQTVEDLGDRAIQAGEKGITPDKFDRFDDYMKAINDFEIDPERSSSLSQAQKVAAGLGVGTLGLQDKLDISDAGGIWILGASCPDYFTTDRLSALLGETRDIPRVLRYFEGKLGLAEGREVADMLVRVDQKLSPGKDEAASYQDLEAQVARFQRPEAGAN